MVKNLYLKPRRHPLIHFQVLFCTVQGASAFLVQHFPGGKVPDTVIEADLTELVVVGHEVPKRLDLLHFSLGVHDNDQGLIFWSSDMWWRLRRIVKCQTQPWRNSDITFTEYLLFIWCHQLNKADTTLFNSLANSLNYDGATISRVGKCPCLVAKCEWF